LVETAAYASVLDGRDEVEEDEAGKGLYRGRVRVRLGVPQKEILTIVCSRLDMSSSERAKRYMNSVPITMILAENSTR
jgi:hypothetical protein